MPFSPHARKKNSGNNGINTRILDWETVRDDGNKSTTFAGVREIRCKWGCRCGHRINVWPTVWNWWWWMRSGLPQHEGVTIFDEMCHAATERRDSRPRLWRFSQKNSYAWLASIWNARGQKKNEDWEKTPSNLLSYAPVPFLAATHCLFNTAHFRISLEWRALIPCYWHN